MSLMEKWLSKFSVPLSGGHQLYLRDISVVHGDSNWSDPQGIWLEIGDPSSHVCPSRNINSLHAKWRHNYSDSHVVKRFSISTGVDALLGARYCNDEYKYCQVKLSEAPGTLKQCERCVEICYVLSCQ